MANALILNASYEPIKIIHWQKAIVLWLQERVEVLDFHTLNIRSVSESFPLPSVIKLKRYINIRGNRPVRLTRHNIFLRDEFQCQYCRSIFAKKELTIDHVMPLSKGGLHIWENVTTACHSCNNKKGSKSLAAYGRPLLTLPSQPSWLPHTEIKYKTKKIPDAWKAYLNIEEFL